MNWYIVRRTKLVKNIFIQLIISNIEKLRKNFNFLRFLQIIVETNK